MAMRATTTVVVGQWTVVLEQGEGPLGQPTLRVAVGVPTGTYATPAQVVFSQVVEEVEQQSPAAAVSGQTESSPAPPRRKSPAERSGIHIDALPPEVQHHVLTFLEPKDILLRIGLASRRWQQLTEDAALWHTLHAQIFGGPPVRAVSLKLSGRESTQNPWFQSLRHLLKEQLKAEREHNKVVEDKRQMLGLSITREEAALSQRKQMLESAVAQTIEQLELVNLNATLRRACKYGSMVVVRKILEKNPALLNARLDYKGRTAIAVAVRYNQMELASYLLGKGADSCGLLQSAVQRGNEEAVRALLAVLSSVYKEPERLPSADFELSESLHVAVWKGHLGIIKLLLSYGAYVMSRAKDGRTALEEAEVQHNPAILATLLAHVEEKAVPNSAAQE